MKTMVAKSRRGAAPIRWIAGVACTALAAYAASAQVQLEPGTWTLRVVTTTNGKADLVQNSEQCLGDELKNLGSYFAPQLEGAEADCKRTQEPTGDPRKIVHRLECTGDGFTMAAATTVTLVDSRQFTANIRIDTKTQTESASVVADAEGRWTGVCKAQ
jgi:Protein of unknown function (DUF3617)